MRQQTVHNEVAVIIPVYREEMSGSEQLCLKRNLEILSAHPIVIVAPIGLNLANYKEFGHFSVEYFEERYFNGLSGYNRFMLSSEFYERFISFNYVLICQLDVFIFSDQLNYWCSRNFDYIGAPWINKPIRILSYVAKKAGFRKAFRVLFKRNIFNAVGNGGFSLRKTETFLSSLNENKEAAKNWRANEDYFWSFFATNRGKILIKPNTYEASQFCIEMSASLILKRNQNKLPFAIHAWKRFNPKIWEPILNNLGYDF